MKTTPFSLVKMKLILILQLEPFRKVYLSSIDHRHAYTKCVKLINSDGNEDQDHCLDHREWS